jgi:hypothetical protein
VNGHGCGRKSSQDGLYGTSRALPDRRMMRLDLFILNTGTRWGVSSQLKAASVFSLKTRKVCRSQLKCDGTRAETRFRLSRETDESI